MKSDEIAEKMLDPRTPDGEIGSLLNGMGVDSNDAQAKGEAIYEKFIATRAGVDLH